MNNLLQDIAELVASHGYTNDDVDIRVTFRVRAPASAPTPELTKTERAIAIFMRDPSRQVKDIAADVGCSTNLLYKSPRFVRLREAYMGNVQRGVKIDGVADADAEE